MNFLKAGILVIPSTKKLIFRRNQSFAFLLTQYCRHHLVACQELCTLAGMWQQKYNLRRLFNMDRKSQNWVRNKVDRDRNVSRGMPLLSADLVFFSSSELSNIGFDVCHNSIPQLAATHVSRKKGESNKG